MNWFKSTAVRVALIFFAGTVILFAGLAIALNIQSRQTFTDVVGGIHFVPQQSQDGIVLLPQIDMLHQQVLSTDGQKRTPSEAFEERFRTSLFWVSILGVGIALLLGAVITQQFLILPLTRLQKAIKQLRQRNFSEKLEHTGLPEFDGVASSFNDLAHELERVEALRKELISDTSHELKTPITSLQVQLEGMRDGLIPLDKDRVAQLLKHVERLGNVTEQLQEYARMRNKAATLERTEISLQELVQAALAEQQDALSKATLKVEVAIPSELKINADKKLLEQVFSNLIRNVLTHAKATKLKITATNDKIVFADNGEGIPDEAIHHVFERFYRVERSRNRVHGGLGLGLAIVREIVEVHGWTIHAEHNKPKGLRIVIATTPAP